MLFATLAYCHFVLIPLEEAWLQDTHPELFEEHIKTGAPRPLKRPALLLQYIVLKRRPGCAVPLPVPMWAEYEGGPSHTSRLSEDAPDDGTAGYHGEL